METVDNSPLTKVLEIIIQDKEVKIKKLTEALEKIANWELPATGQFWDDEKTRPMGYESAYGSNGAREYIKSIAKEALKD